MRFRIFIQMTRAARLLFFTSRKDTRTVRSPATATWLMSCLSLWYGHNVSVPLPRCVNPYMRARTHTKFTVEPYDNMLHHSTAEFQILTGRRCWFIFWQYCSCKSQVYINALVIIRYRFYRNRSLTVAMPYKRKFQNSLISKNRTNSYNLS